jgi:hypothetical protein
MNSRRVSFLIICIFHYIPLIFCCFYIFSYLLSPLVLHNFPTFFLWPVLGPCISSIEEQRAQRYGYCRLRKLPNYQKKGLVFVFSYNTLDGGEGVVGRNEYISVWQRVHRGTLCRSMTYPLVRLSILELSTKRVEWRASVEVKYYTNRNSSPKTTTPAIIVSLQYEDTKIRKSNATFADMIIELEIRAHSNCMLAINRWMKNFYEATSWCRLCSNCFSHQQHRQLCRR